jgi:hypothetical protein
MPPPLILIRDGFSALGKSIIGIFVNCLIHRGYAVTPRPTFSIRDCYTTGKHHPKRATKQRQDEPRREDSGGGKRGSGGKGWFGGVPRNQSFCFLRFFRTERSQLRNLKFMQIDIIPKNPTHQPPPRKPAQTNFGGVVPFDLVDCLLGFKPRKRLEIILRLLRHPSISPP